MKKRKLNVLIVFLIVISCIGVSYAIFTYNKSLDMGALVGSEIYFKITNNEDVTGSNCFPMDASRARNISDNTITFTIEGKNTTSSTLTYTIDIVNRKVNGKENIPFKFVNIDLVDSNNIFYANDVNLVDYKSNLPSFTVSPNTDYQIGYVVRFWVNKDILISDSNVYANYKLTDNGPSYLTKFSDTVLAFDVIVTSNMS